MKILMISIDKGLLGRGQLGDVLDRHKKYGEHCERLDIIVLSSVGYENYQLSNKVTAYPTNSKKKWQYYYDAMKIGKELFGRYKYDLIVTQEPFITGLIGCQLKKKFGTKLLIHFHGDFWNNPSWLKERSRNRLLLWLSKYTVRCADAVRVMSEGQKEKICQQMSSRGSGATVGIPWSDKIRVISTTVDLSKFKVENEKLKVEDDEKKVLHVGRDDEVKDFDTLLKAFKLVSEKNNNAKFWQVGADKKLKEAIGKNNFNNIELKGKQDQNKLIELYHQCDIVVLSSTSESFGKVLVEANACGKPVVSTATTGAREIIRDGYNGFLAPIGDAKMLAEKIVWLLDNPEKAKEMGENGRQLVQKKYGDNMEKVIQYWRDIVCHPERSEGSNF